MAASSRASLSPGRSLERRDDRVHERRDLDRVQPSDPSQRRRAERRVPAASLLQAREQTPHHQAGERGPVLGGDDRVCTAVRLTRVRRLREV